MGLLASLKLGGLDHARFYIWI
ncbi:BnaC03g67180D [Brassica napus]|uniref:BnaC03g67180D protein n=3 Tax=Brassica napus TaxID=3708 RepID=A0A078IUZ6_BRANA|nr:BnaC03g67180D [Brassica napus]